MVESNRNGLTNSERAKLAALTREFSAICTHGRILYLGTPQTMHSVYNSLPGRGYTPRIWPGRFPTEEQEVLYGQYLAPSIIKRMEILGPQCRTGGGIDGKQGWPTDPERFDEETLCVKELDWGPEGFQLQYMLNTRMSDIERQQLRPRDLIVPDIDFKMVPENLGWAVDKKAQWDMGADYPITGAELFAPAYMGGEYRELSQLTMTIDPAGSGGDEVAFAIGGVLGPYIHVIGWGGYKGGLSDDNLAKLAELVKQYNVKSCVVERNMGAGTATRVISGYFLNEAGLRGQCGVSDAQSVGQKERRIIDLLRPILSKHRLVMHKSAVDMDFSLLSQYSRERRADYCGMYQLSTITTDRGSLRKDDRVDVLEQLCRALSEHLVIDEEKAARERQKAEAQEFMNNPMGYSKNTLRQLGMLGTRVKHRFAKRRGL